MPDRCDYSDYARAPSDAELARESREAAIETALVKPRACMANCMAALAVMRMCAISHDVSDDFLVDAQDCVKRTFQDIEDAIRSGEWGT